MKKVFVIVSIAVLPAIFGGCYYDNAELLYPGGANCSGISPSYSLSVAPLIQARCAIAGCHSAGASNKGGPLTNYNEIKFKAAAIKASVLNRSMPQGSSFTADEIKTISCWVDNGSLNN